MLSKNRSFVRYFIASFFAVILSAGSAHANGAAPKKADGPIYVDFKSIVVPVIKKNGRTGVIALNVMGEVKNAKDQEKVTSHMPKLRDAFIRALYGNLDSNKFARADGTLDIDSIKDRLMKTAAYVMQDKKASPIKDILFQQIAQQSY